jgi:hypothetical protein
MFWFTFGIAGGLVVSIAAAVATVFTFATATPPIVKLQMSKQSGVQIKAIYDVNRTAKGDRLQLHLIFPQVAIPETDDNTTVNQTRWNVPSIVPKHRTRVLRVLTGASWV